MATIVTRSGKGSALTFAEGDANFTNLNTDKIELTDLSVTQNAASGAGTLSYSNTTGVFSYTPPTAAGLGAISLTAISVGAEGTPSGDGSLAYDNETGVFTYTPPTASGLGALENVVEDTTPQLGGDLDLNENDITGTGNVDITGNVIAQSAINAQTGTTYTTVLADASKLVTLSNASAITLTIPANSSVAYPVGTKIDLAQIGAGQVTVAGAGGVTVNATPSLSFRAQYSAATCIKTATDTWLLVGDLAAGE